MSYNNRSNWEDRNNARAAGCLIGLGVGAIIALWQLFQPKPKPYRPAALTNPHNLGSQVNPLAWCVGAATGCAWCIAIISNIKDTGSSWLLYGIGIVMGGLTLYFGWKVIAPPDITQSRFDAPSPKRAITFSIYPSLAKPEYVSGSNLIGSLLSHTPTLTFQIVGSPMGIVWQVVDPIGSQSADIIRDQLRSYGENMTVVVEKKGAQLAPPSRFPFYRQILFFGLANDYAAPIAQLDMLKSYDPLIPITNRLDLIKRNQDERIIYSLTTLVASPQAKTCAALRIKARQIRPLSPITQDQQGNEVLLDDQAFEEKLTATLYHAVLTITVESKNKKRLTELAAIASEVSHFGYPGYNTLSLVSTSPADSIVTEEDDSDNMPLAYLADWSLSPEQEWRDALLVLCPSELAALWHLPNELFTASSITKSVPAIPEALTTIGKDRIVIGDSVQYGNRTPISVSFAERSTHQYVAGKTNMGKSTLLHTLIHQDIQAGRGVVVVDPHGKLVDDVLLHSIPQARLKDVALLECGNTEYPVPLNPFRRPEGISFDSAFNSIYWTLKKIYEEIWIEGRTEMALRNALLALLLDPEATPLDIQRVFIEAPYREYLVGLLGKHESGSLSTLNYWQGFAKMTHGQQGEIADPILSRTGAFLGRKHLEHMTCCQDRD